MAWWRKIGVILLLAVIVFGHAFDVVRLREHWPFSYYPMYAKLRSDKIARHGVLRGTTTDLKLNEIDLNAAYLTGSADKMLVAFQRDPMAVRDQLRSLLRWNNHLALDRTSRRPRLTSIALYEVNTELSADNESPSPPGLAFVTRVFVKPKVATTQSTTDSSDGGAQ